MLKVRTAVMKGTLERDHIALDRRAARNVVQHSTPKCETVSVTVQERVNNASMARTYPGIFVTTQRGMARAPN